MESQSRTHYEILGVERDAAPSVVRAAFRKLALRYHPDRSKDAGAVERFLEAKTAYEVLRDPDRRREYDKFLMLQEQLRAKEAEARASSARAAAIRQPKRSAPRSEATADVVADVTRLANLFARGRYTEAERLANAVIQKDPKQAIAYAVLGDIVRARGDFHRASKLYAFAAQMEPRNPVYLRKHEEMLEAVAARPVSVYVATRKEANAKSAAPIVGAFMAALAAVYIAVSNEQPAFPNVSPISTWTLGLMALLFLSGVAVGASLSVGDLLDRFETFGEATSARLSPSVALLVIACANFWAAAGLYLQAGLVRGAFQYSTTRVLCATAAVVGLFTLAASLSPSLSAGEVALWGGNLVYLGAVCGWMAADSLKG